MSRLTANYRFQGIVVKTLFTLSTLLPLDFASWLGGALARRFGPVIAYKAHRIAINNLTAIFPDMPENERNQLLSHMWDNLGRVGAELPHLRGEKIFTRMTFKGLEHLPKPGTPVIFISGHYGNWELTYPIAHNHGVPVSLIYRHANNPYVDDIICSVRSSRSTSMFPKGGRGAIRMAHAIKRGESLAMLIDQKMNDGISVPFFGHEAMTAPAVAALAIRYNLPILPARVVRTHGVHFTWELWPPLDYKKTGDEKKDTLLLMTEINALLEKWIREYPEQWFWVHRRWPKEAW